GVRAAGDHRSGDPGCGTDRRPLERTEPMTDTERPTGQLLFRSATQIGVNYPDRIIELVVMPYETETLVERDGRMVREIISRGAFDGIERRANRIRVNRDHDVTRTIGRAVALR